MPVDRDEVLKLFGASVGQRRRALGITQEGLAELTGLHRTYIDSVERGERNPTLTTLVAIAAGLSWSLAELVSFRPPA